MIATEQEGFASFTCYRALWHSLKATYGINIQQEILIKTIRELDTDETENCHRLTRRKYVSQGINIYYIYIFYNS